MKSLIIIVLSLVLAEASLAQNSEENYTPKMFGIGLNMMNLRVSDYMTDELYNSPSNNLMIEITPWKHIRITPHIGYASRKLKVDGPDENEYEDKRTSLSVGGGLFGMFQKKRTNFYGGIRMEYSEVKYDFVEFDYDYVPYPPYTVYTHENKTLRYVRATYAPTVGAEYFIGDHFSLGGEFQVRFMQFQKYTPSEYYAYDSEMKSMTSFNAGFQVRFYF